MESKSSPPGRRPLPHRGYIQLRRNCPPGWSKALMGSLNFPEPIMIFFLLHISFILMTFIPSSLSSPTVCPSPTMEYNGTRLQFHKQHVTSYTFKVINLQKDLQSLSVLPFTNLPVLGADQLEAPVLQVTVSGWSVERTFLWR